MKSRQGTHTLQVTTFLAEACSHLVYSCDWNMTIPLAVNHESEVTMWSSSIKDLERQQDRLARVSILSYFLTMPGNFLVLVATWFNFLQTLFSLQGWQRTVEQQKDHPARSTFSPSQMRCVQLFVSSGTCATPSPPSPATCLLQSTIASLVLNKSYSGLALPLRTLSHSLAACSQAILSTLVPRRGRPASLRMVSTSVRTHLMSSVTVSRVP